MRTHYVVGDRVVRVEVKKGREAGRFEVGVGDATHQVEAVRADGGRIFFVIDGRPVRAAVAVDGDLRRVKLEGRGPVEFEAGETVSRRSRSRGDAGLLAATMHSQVVSVEVAVGDSVAAGDTLLVLEAMKMETRITAPHAGAVTAVHCGAGDVVEPGVSLVELEASD